MLKDLMGQVLKNGDSGSHVEMIQKALAASGFDLGKADGLFGPKTESALKAFQEKSGLGMDGIAGPNTLKALGPLLKDGLSTEAVGNMLKGAAGDKLKEAASGKAKGMVKGLFK